MRTPRTPKKSLVSSAYTFTVFLAAVAWVALRQLSPVIAVPASLAEGTGIGSADASETVAACCFDPATCSVLDQADCESGGGVWLGNEQPPVVDCTSSPCAGISTGACCTGSTCAVDF